jgi:hypothetical protein
MMHHTPQEISRPAARESDIQLIVGGNFTPDALSPDVYDSIIGRVNRWPTQYLASFRDMFVKRRLDPDTYSRLHLGHFLGLVAAKRPEEVRQTARELQAIYDGILSSHGQTLEASAQFKSPRNDDEGVLQRLHIRRTELAELAKAK